MRSPPGWLQLSELELVRGALASFRPSRLVRLDALGLAMHLGLADARGHLSGFRLILGVGAGDGAEAKVLDEPAGETLVEKLLV